MRKFDSNGIILAEYQGKLFEASYDLNCSSAIFIKKFLNSYFLELLDKNESCLLSLDVDEGLTKILKEPNEINFGKDKFSKNTLFWIGYMYRYISYTREQSTKFVSELFSYKQMNDVFYVYHTQDEEWCIRNLLAINNLNENIFDNNYRLKQLLRLSYEKNLSAN